MRETGEKMDNFDWNAPLRSSSNVTKSPAPHHSTTQNSDPAASDTSGNGDVCNETQDSERERECEGDIKHTNNTRPNSTTGHSATPGGDKTKKSSESSAKDSEDSSDANTAQSSGEGSENQQMEGSPGEREEKKDEIDPYDSDHLGSRIISRSLFLSLYIYMYISPITPITLITPVVPTPPPLFFSTRRVLLAWLHRGIYTYLHIYTCVYMYIGYQDEASAPPHPSSHSFAVDIDESGLVNPNKPSSHTPLISPFVTLHG